MYHPFPSLGMDFTGALYVKQQNNEESNVYICLCHLQDSPSRGSQWRLHCPLPAGLSSLCCQEVTTDCHDIRQSNHLLLSCSRTHRVDDLWKDCHITGLGRHCVEIYTKESTMVRKLLEGLIRLTKMAVMKTLGRAHVNLVTLQMWLDLTKPASTHKTS